MRRTKGTDWGNDGPAGATINEWRLYKRTKSRYNHGWQCLSRQKFAVIVSPLSRWWLRSSPPRCRSLVDPQTYFMKMSQPQRGNSNLCVLHIMPETYQTRSHAISGAKLFWIPVTMDTGRITWKPWLVTRVLRLAASWSQHSIKGGNDDATLNEVA